MAGKDVAAKTLLDRVEKMIRRYHSTTDEPLRGIFSANAIKTTKGRHHVYESDGQWKKRNPDGTFVYVEETRPVFTSKRMGEWDMGPQTKTLVLEIPESVYKGMKRTDINPDYPPAVQRRGLGEPEKVFSVDRGGSADFFLEDLPLDYVKGGYIGKSRKMVPLDSLRHILGIVEDK